MPAPPATASSRATTSRALDKRIAAISIPALGSLVAEPLYLFVDSKIVADIGTHELAALGLAMQVLLAVVGLCVFLAYGTTTEVARATAERSRAALGVQGLWLGAATGTAVAALLVLLAGPMMDVLGDGSSTADLAARYLRLSAVGVAAQLVAIAGQGWLRGREQLGVALRLVVMGQLINLIAEVVLVYGFELGLDGSALGTVIAQVSMAAVTILLVLRSARSTGATLRPDPPTLLRMSRFGGLLLVRSIALSGGYLVVAGSAGRISDEALSAHQVATLYLWIGALSLDALAIAAQVLVSSALGGDDLPAARRAAARVTLISSGFGILVGGGLALAGPSLVTSVISDDPGVADAARGLWPWFCAVQFVGGVVFALDGVLIGAGDGRILATSMVIAAVVLCLTLVVIGNGTLAELWAAILAMFLARGVTLGLRALRGPLQRAPAAAF